MVSYNVTANLSCVRLSLHDQFMDTWPLFQPVQLVFAALYAIIVFVGLIGNAGMLLRICRMERFRFSSNLFLANLSVAEIFLGVAFLAFSEAQIIRKPFYWGSLVCKVFPLSQIMAVFECSMR